MQNATVGGNTAGEGGGIYNLDGSVTLTDATVADNFATGTPALGGGIYNNLETAGSLSLLRTTVSGNTADEGNGGGIYARRVPNASTINIESSSLDDNRSASGAGLFVKRGRVAVTGSAIVNNTASANGGGIYLDLDGSGGSVAVANSTIADNKAASGGGIGIDKLNTADSSLVHTTVANNTATAANGGGGIGYGAPADGALAPNAVFPGILGNAFTSNLIAKNNAAGETQNCRNAFDHKDASNSGYNVSDDTSCGFNKTNDSQTEQASKIAGLADNLGPTKTVALLAGNPAIDRSNPLYADGASLDQRGLETVDGNDDGSDLRDAGAYEFGALGVVQFDQASYTVREDSSPATIVVERFGNTAPAGSVKLSTADGATNGATAGLDYDAQTAVGYGFGEDENAASVPVTIKEDNLQEGTENITLSLSAPNAGADLGPRSTANLAVQDIEEGALQFSAATYSENEDVGLTKTIMVGRGSGKDEAVSVQVSIQEDTAKKGKDYVDKTEILSWADGDDAPKPFTVELIQDDDPEGSTAFKLALSAATGGARLGSQATATFTITDTDTHKQGKFRLDAASYTVNESAKKLVVSVQRVEGDDDAVTVKCVTEDGSAKAGAGLDLTNPNATLQWGDDESQAKECTIDINDDTARESSKAFTVKLTEPTGGAELGTPSSAPVTLVSDEKPRYQFGQTSYSVPEGGLIVELTVEPVDAVDGDTVKIGYATGDGTATALVDYLATSGELTWNNGEMQSQSISVGIVNDSAAEGNEAFDVTLEAVSGGEIVSTNPVTVTIVDPPAFRLSSAAYASTGEGGVITVTVERIGSAQGAASVRYDVTGNTATAGTDYTPPAGGATGTLTWGNNDSASKTLQIAVLGDSTFEGDEMIDIVLSNPSAGVVLATPSTAVATITDDDSEPTVTLEIDNASIGENAGTATVKAKLSNPTTKVVKVNLAYAGTALAGSDYTAVSVITVAANAASGEAALAALDDATDEANETVAIDIASVENAAESGVQSVSTVIVDDDPAPTVGVANAIAVAEGNTGTATLSFTVSLSAASGQTVTVDYATANGTATAGSDYVANSGTLTFASGETAKTVTVTVNGDRRDEANETLNVTLANPANASLGTASATGTITDDDTAAIVVAQSGGSTEVSESGATDTYTLVLATEPAADVTITLSAGSQLSVGPTALTFTAANYATPQTVTVRAVNDGKVEGAHSGLVQHTAASGDAKYDGASVSSVTAGITDNDKAGDGGGSLSWLTLSGLGLLLALRRRCA